MSCRSLIILLMTLVATSACHQEESSSQPVRVARVYEYMRDFAALDSAAAAERFVADSVEIEAFMRTVSELPLSHDLIEGWANSDAVTVFTPAVDSVFADSSALSRTLGVIVARMDENGMKIPADRFAAVVYGRRESILFVDSVMLIALNHYLGSDYPGYSHWPTYLRAAKTPQNMPYDIAEALAATAQPFIADPSGVTLLSRMLYEGSLAYARLKLVPGSSEEDALGYTEAQLRQLRRNEVKIWHSIVADRLLYDTSDALADRLTAPSPQVSIVRPSAPGRVGRYIGYQIVRKYMERHPDTELSTLLSPQFYNSPTTLAQSGY